jgi:hypothetical protein
MALVIVVGAAIALEGLQHLTPDRHGRLVDGLLGVLIAVAVSRYLAALSARSPTTGAR